MTIPVITAYNWSPDRGRGLVRDMRVRWALEEIGQPYDVRYLSWGQQKESAHRARNPFGQVPAYEEGDLVLFESGAIIFHIAESGPGLFPEDPAARARAIEWMFAALNSVEPVIWDLIIAKIIEGDHDWTAARLPLVEERLGSRLGDLSARLGDSEWLEDSFSAGDLLMVSVLRPIEGSDAIAKFPNLEAYVARGVARPAFKRAFDKWKAGQTGETPAAFAQPKHEPEGEAA